MFNFNENRYIKVVNDALALTPIIEKAADDIHAAGYSNIFFIGCGGTYAHTLPMKYFLDTNTNIESHCVIAAEFVVMGHKRFSKDSICIFSTRSGNTKEIVEAAAYCRKAGARVVLYVCHENTPAQEHADYVFNSFAEDDHLGEAIYIVNYTFLMRLANRAGFFPGYDKFVEQMRGIAPYLIKGKALYEDRCRALAERHKATDYHMVIGAGYMWGEAYDYAMCILEEMQWIKTKSIHGAEFFHGTLELVEEDTSLLLLYGEDTTRPIMDRVLNFARKVTKEIAVFDTAEVELPLDKEFREFMSPMIIYVILERFSCHLEHFRNHPLTTRRYYRQIEY